MSNRESSICASFWSVSPVHETLGVRVTTACVLHHDLKCVLVLGDREVSPLLLPASSSHSKCHRQLLV
jgi:hypothetical protein